ncbi:MAG: DUF58 domain-containing protein [Clostridia bacterium]|nr:DUF58 domain-containing protein [Clostridia bacterium]
MKNRQRFLIGTALLLIVLFVGGRLPGFFLYLYLGLMAIPYLHGHYGLRHLAGKIELPKDDLIAGEEITLTTTFFNPTKITFPNLEYNNSLFELLSRKAAQPERFHLAPDSRYIDETALRCNRRGIYTLGRTELLIKDVFNLFTFKKALEAPIALKIYPRVLQLSDFTLEAGIQIGDLMVNDPLFQDYSAVDTLRTYRPGDSVKRIHWRASARHESLIVKEFECRGDAQAILLLNAFQDDYAHDLNQLTEDTIVEIGVSVTNFFLNQQLNISYIYTARDGYDKITGDTASDLRMFLESFISFSPRNTQPLYHDIQKISPAMIQGTTLIIVTPVIDKALATILVDLKMKNIKPMVFLFNDGHNSTAPQTSLMRKLLSENIPVSKLGLSKGAIAYD